MKKLFNATTIIPILLVRLCITNAWTQSGVTERTINLDFKQVKGHLNTMFKECVGAGRANEGLRADWQQQLAYVKKECGFKYIRMHGLLTDDMGKPNQLTTEQVRKIKELNDGSATSTERIKVKSGAPFTKELEIRENDVFLITMTKRGD
jgi:beta-xylosidase